jgi:hypothetical protein
MVRCGLGTAVRNIQTQRRGLDGGPRRKTPSVKKAPILVEKAELMLSTLVRDHLTVIRQASRRSQLDSSAELGHGA